MEQSQIDYETTLCKRFLTNPDLNPEDQTKRLLPGKKPYLRYIDLCRKHNFDVDRILNAELDRNKVYQRRQTLRPRPINNNLLAAVLLTVADFQAIAKLPYEQFLTEVIAITNENGGAIDRNYFNEKAYWRQEIIIAIPFKYTSTKAGSDYISFNKPQGFTNGELLYQLAPFINSKSVNFMYFQGLSPQNDGSYRLELSYESW